MCVQDGFFRYDFPKRTCACLCGEVLPPGEPTLRIVTGIDPAYGIQSRYSCIKCGNEWVKEVQRAYARITKAMGEAMENKEV